MASEEDSGRGHTADEAAPRRHLRGGTHSGSDRGRAATAWMLVPLAVFVLLTALVLRTGTPEAGELMQQASASFGEVSRGEFGFAITITPRGSDTAETSTIRLEGPFELLPDKDLPLARVKYTIGAGERSEEIELLATGDKAYTVVQGQAYELPPAATKDLRKATKQLKSGGDDGEQTGLSGLKLNFGRWLIDPQVGSGADLDGTPTWRTRAAVDVVAAIKDLNNSASVLGGVTGNKIPELTEKDVAEIKDSFRNAKVEVFVGRYDRIVRKVALTMDFVTPEGFSAAAGGIGGGRLDMLVTIGEPNRPVDVKPPKDPLPYRALQSLSQGGSSGTALDDGLGK